MGYVALEAPLSIRKGTTTTRTGGRKTFKCTLACSSPDPPEARAEVTVSIVCVALEAPLSIGKRTTATRTGRRKSFKCTLACSSPEYVDGDPDVVGVAGVLERNVVLDDGKAAAIMDRRASSDATVSVGVFFPIRSHPAREAGMAWREVEKAGGAKGAPRCARSGLRIIP